MTAKTHSVSYRIYYEDTDAGSVVYYANYLKFAERGRTEMLRSAGIEQHVLLQDHDRCFVVRHATLDLEKPAKLDDEITVHTYIESIHGATLTIKQTITKQQTVLARITCKVVCVNQAFTPKRIPSDVQKRCLLFLQQQNQ